MRSLATYEGVMDSGNIQTVKHDGEGDHGNAGGSDRATSFHTIFNTWIQSRLQGLVYKSDVPNWYTDKRTGRNTLIWPGSLIEFWWLRCVRKVNGAHFEFQD